jgi:hypothetical protein
MRRCFWSSDLVNDEALSNWGLLRQKQNKKKKGYLEVRICHATASINDYTVLQATVLKIGKKMRFIY